MKFDLEYCGNGALVLIKNASFFPYKTGKLKWNATSGYMMTDTTYRIHFSSTIAPYVEYLEEGTSPHNIPRAFGKPLPFGTKGRFDGKFHPGSSKHKGFIKNDCVHSIIDYICDHYNGVLQ